MEAAMSKFTVICAWCRAFMYDREGAPGISHGICSDCLYAMQLDLAKSNQADNESWFEPDIGEAGA